ncbi:MULTISPECIES: GxxExxY protein [unclassified Lentimonas]|uniref:GxxExxY protein n=1 Tax=unclassified Lentimonas TaxID=2630993 RepID=UPI0013232A74|nr:MULTISPECIES: GxxExxY protein [unclassified Lentimonas]CAA6694076.1 Unannotated [Lentimonas sp. CC10]CAA6697566.1 Unannotated [Lentimonas sp. CC19]CAA7072413.1 Unannotated [Lentimonas sp. CC11]
MSTEILFKNESYQLIGACFEVYNEMGFGFLEPVYQESLEMEFTSRAIPFNAQQKLQIHYKQQPLKQSYEPDFLCFEKIVIEIKAVKTLNDEHRAQIINYLKATKMQLGLLVNFGHRGELQYERFVNVD